MNSVQVSSTSSGSGSWRSGEGGILMPSKSIYKFPICNKFSYSAFRYVSLLIRLKKSRKLVLGFHREKGSFFRPVEAGKKL
jgi:hypothetical protein